MKPVERMTKRELRQELAETRVLLAVGKCPNNCIDGMFIHTPVDGPIPCQWCAERSALVGVC